jgi:hypothetical protein
VFSDLLPSNGHSADYIENTSCNTFSIVACAYFGRCLEKGLHVTILSFLHYNETENCYLMVISLRIILYLTVKKSSVIKVVFCIILAVTEVRVLCIPANIAFCSCWSYICTLILTIIPPCLLSSIDLYPLDRGADYTGTELINRILLPDNKPQDAIVRPPIQKSRFRSDSD